MNKPYIKSDRFFEEHIAYLREKHPELFTTKNRDPRYKDTNVTNKVFKIYNNYDLKIAYSYFRYTHALQIMNINVCYIEESNRLDSESKYVIQRELAVGDIIPPNSFVSNKRFLAVVTKLDYDEIELLPYNSSNFQELTCKGEYSNLEGVIRVCPYKMNCARYVGTNSNGKPSTFCINNGIYKQFKSKLEVIYGKVQKYKFKNIPKNSTPFLSKQLDIDYNKLKYTSDLNVRYMEFEYANIFLQDNILNSNEMLLVIEIADYLRSKDKYIYIDKQLINYTFLTETNFDDDIMYVKIDKLQKGSHDVMVKIEYDTIKGIQTKYKKATLEVK